MSKVTLNDLSNLSNETTVVTSINNNNSTIETAFDNTLSRDGTTPNQMNSNLDMNSNRVINIGAPVNSQDAIRLIDLQTASGDAAALAAAVGQAQAYAASSAASATLSGSSATSSGTSSSAAAASATSAAASAAAAAASLASFTSSGVWNNTTQLSKTANYTVVSGDKTKTILLGGTTCFTLTFGAAGTYPADFIVFVQNTDTTRAKVISLNGVKTFLWPGTGGFIYNAGSTWYTTYPFIWVWSGVQFTTYVDATNGNDANDGLTSVAGVSPNGPLKTINAAIDRVHNFYDVGKASALIQLATSQSYNGGDGVGGPVVVVYAQRGSSQIQIIGNPANPNITSITCTAGSTIIDVEEPATLTLQGVILIPGGAGSVGINVRQFATCDLVSVNFAGFGGSTMVQGDNKCSINFNSASNIQSGAVSGFNVSNGASITFGGLNPILTFNNGLTFTSSVFSLDSGAVIKFDPGASISLAGGPSSVAGATALINGNAILVKSTAFGSPPGNGVFTVTNGGVAY